MTKANQRALEAYPKRKDGRARSYYCTDDDVRKIYAQGYKKAEKDNTLTLEDVNRIGELFNICQDKLEKDNSGYADWGVPTKVLAQEVLKSFYEEKNN